MTTATATDERTHHNRPLRQLRPHTDDVLAAVLARIGVTDHTGGPS